MKLNGSAPMLSLKLQFKEANDIYQTYTTTSSNRRLKSAFEFSQVWYVKTKQKFYRQHFVPEPLDRREIGLPAAGVKTNELIA